MVFTIRCIYVDEFRFQLRNNQLDLMDIVSYTLTKDNFSVTLVVIGIDTTTPCGPSSSVDFTYFIWDNFEPFSFKKHSITSLPSEDGSDPTMLYLKSHRTKSDGWRDSILCSSCKINFMGMLQHFVPCNLLENCSCNICISHPPSLVASATHVVFNHTFNLEKFELTVDTTYEQYVYAFLSNRVNSQKLLPPLFPKIEVSFRCDKHNFETKLHIHCPVPGSCHMKSSTIFESPDQAINELMKEENFYWCAFCQKPLFFPRLCREHF